MAIRPITRRCVVKEAANCEYCINYVFDEEDECYTCEVSLDEDEMLNFLKGAAFSCPYFRMDDDYRVVRKQM